MKIKILPVLFGLAVVFAANQASAYYSPSTGRWLSRDPVDELGFQALHAAQRVPLVSTIPSIPPGRLFKRDPFIPEFDPKRPTVEEKNLYAFVGNDAISFYDAVGNCICVFKGRTGELTIDSSCKGVLSIWVIDEHSAPAAGAVSGTTVDADGYVMDGTTYKIDGSTCVTMTRSGGKVTVSTCVNCVAAMLGKKAPYPVTLGSLGPHPKEPMPGSTPPVAK